MENLDLPQAKLLHFVSDLRKQNEINDAQKAKLKQIILFEDARLMELLSNYEQNGDRTAFRDGVLALIQDKDNLPSLGIKISKNSDEGQEPQGFDEGSSPLDNRLFQKKKHQQSGNEHGGLAAALKPMQ